MPDDFRQREVLLSIHPVHGWGYTPKEFISVFDACKKADRLMERLFTAEFGDQMLRVNGAAAAYIKVGNLPILIIPNITWLEAGRSW